MGDVPSLQQATLKNIDKLPNDFQNEVGEDDSLVPHFTGNFEVLRHGKYGTFCLQTFHSDQKQAQKASILPFGNTETSDFSHTNLRTFEAKPPYFLSKKSVLLEFPAEKQ